MADEREDRVRDRAYRLWQQDGEPHGRDRDHWDQAEREIADAGAAIDADASAAATAIGGDTSDTPAAAPMPSDPPTEASPADEPDAPPAPVAAPVAAKSPAKKPVTRRKRPG